MSDPFGALTLQRRGDIPFFDATQWQPITNRSELRSLIIQNGVPTFIDPNVGYATLYNFSMKVKGHPVTLTGGVAATVTLGPVPAGVNGTDTHHYLYISGGTGTAEAVLITGGTALSGAPIGTVTFTPANNHSGEWTISSASHGIVEAMYSCPNLPIVAPPGSLDIYAPIYVVLSTAGLVGAGPNQTDLLLHYTADDGIVVQSGHPSFYIRDLSIVPAANMTAGALVSAVSGNVIDIESVFLGGGGGNSGAYIGINVASGTQLSIRGNCLIITNYRGVQGSGFYPLINGLQVIGNKAAGVTPIVGSCGLYFFETAGGFVHHYLQANGSLEYGFYIDTTAAYCNEISISQFYADNYTVAGIAVIGTGSCANWELTNFRLNDDNGVVYSASSATGISLNTGCTNWEVGDGNIGFDNLGILVNGGKQISFDNVKTFPVSSVGGSGGAGIEVINGSFINFTGCYAGDSDSVALGGIGMLVASGTTDYLTVVGNTFIATTQSQRLAITGTLTHPTIANNNGIGSAAKSVASAIAQAFPVMDDQDILTITGTAAPTSVSGLREGQIGILIFTNAAPGIWTAGATIGNTFIPTQNVPVKFAFTGGKIYLS